MNKLTGKQYIEHWQTRMARGPLAAGTLENGNDIWQFIRGFLPKKFMPESVLEYGCAYGRMLRQIHKEWPDARLYGVDLSKEALMHLVQNWQGPPVQIFNQHIPPDEIETDMIFTCTVLQHVTDDGILRSIVKGFGKILKQNGLLVLFENVNWRPGQGGAHMREFAARDYMNLWPDLDWRDCGIFMHGAEAHELMIGKK